MRLAVAGVVLALVLAGLSLLWRNGGDAWPLVRAVLLVLLAAHFAIQARRLRNTMGGQ